MLTENKSTRSTDPRQLELPETKKRKSPTRRRGHQRAKLWELVADKVFDLDAKGLTVSEIAESIRVSGDTVRRALRSRPEISFMPVEVPSLMGKPKFYTRAMVPAPVQTEEMTDDRAHKFSPPPGWVVKQIVIERE